MAAAAAEIKASLNRKLGPLKAWQWAGILVAVVLVWRHYHAPPAAVTGSSGTAATDAGGGFGTTDPSYAGGGGGGGADNQPTPPDWPPAYGAPLSWDPTQAPDQEAVEQVDTGATSPAGGTATKTATAGTAARPAPITKTATVAGRTRTTTTIPLAKGAFTVASLASHPAVKVRNAPAANPNATRYPSVAAAAKALARSYSAPRASSGSKAAATHSASVSRVAPAAKGTVKPIASRNFFASPTGQVKQAVAKATAKQPNFFASPKTQVAAAVKKASVAQETNFFRAPKAQVKAAVKKALTHPAASAPVTHASLSPSGNLFAPARTLTSAAPTKAAPAPPGPAPPKPPVVKRPAAKAAVTISPSTVSRNTVNAPGDSPPVVSDEPYSPAITVTVHSQGLIGGQVRQTGGNLDW